MYVCGSFPPPRSSQASWYVCFALDTCRRTLTATPAGASSGAFSGAPYGPPSGTSSGAPADAPDGAPFGRPSGALTAAPTSLFWPLLLWMAHGCSFLERNIRG